MKTIIALSRVTTVGISLALIAFLLSWGLARHFDRMDAFDQRDLFFDADTDTRLLAMTEGMHLGIKHSNFSAYTTPPVTMVGWLVKSAGVSSMQGEAIRRGLGLTMAPIATALKVLIFCVMLNALGLSLGLLALVALLFILSPTNLIFGSIPETYSLAGLSLAFAFLLAARSRPFQSLLRFAAWVVVGVFAMGVTITNVITVGILFWSAERIRLGSLRAMVHAAILIAVVTAVTGVSSYLYDTLFPSPINPKVDAPQGLQQRAARVVTQVQSEQASFVPKNRRHSITRFPGGVVDALLPADLALHTIEPKWIKKHRFKVNFSLEGTRHWRLKGILGGLFVFGMMAIGVVTAKRAGPMNGSLALGSLLILLYNWVLHALFGKELFLYSQHWHLPLVFLLAAVVAGKQVAWWRVVLLAVCLVAVLINDIALGQRFFEGLLEHRVSTG